MALVVLDRERDLLMRTGFGFVNVFPNNSPGYVRETREDCEKWSEGERGLRPSYRIKITCKTKEPM